MKEVFYNIPRSSKTALITDLHNTAFVPVIDSLKHNFPEIICIAGDIVRGRKTEGNKSLFEVQENIVPFLKSCVKIAPTFMSLGNHEQHFDSQDASLVSSTGVTLLDNSFTEITLEGRKMVIGGLTSATCTEYRQAVEALPPEVRNSGRYPAVEVSISSEAKPETNWLEQFAQQEGYKILLSHHPEYFPLIPKEVDLFLSGHAHGGQIRVYNPFRREWVGVIAHGQGYWPKWTKGVYENGRLVVSAGLSNTFLVPRLFNQTEIVYIGDGEKAKG